MPVLRSLAYRDIDDLLLVVHPFAAVDERDWLTLVDATRRLSDRTDKCLVLPGAVGLTRAQSAQIARVVCSGRMRVAVLLEGRAVRGTVAALGWLTKRYRGFGPNSIAQALAYLRIAPERHEKIFLALDEMGSSMARSDIRARILRSAHA